MVTKPRDFLSLDEVLQLAHHIRVWSPLNLGEEDERGNFAKYTKNQLDFLAFIFLIEDRIPPANTFIKGYRGRVGRTRIEMFQTDTGYRDIHERFYEIMAQRGDFSLIGPRPKSRIVEMENSELEGFYRKVDESTYKFYANRAKRKARDHDLSLDEPIDRLSLLSSPGYVSKLRL